MKDINHIEVLITATDLASPKFKEAADRIDVSLQRFGKSAGETDVKFKNLDKDIQHYSASLKALEDPTNKAIRSKSELAAEVQRLDKEYESITARVNEYYGALRKDDPLTISKGMVGQKRLLGDLRQGYDSLASARKSVREIDDLETTGYTRLGQAEKIAIRNRQQLINVEELKRHSVLSSIKATESQIAVERTRTQMFDRQFAAIESNIRKEASYAKQKASNAANDIAALDRSNAAYRRKSDQDKIRIGQDNIEIRLVTELDALSMKLASSLTRLGNRHKAASDSANGYTMNLRSLKGETEKTIVNTERLAVTLDSVKNRIENFFASFKRGLVWQDASNRGFLTQEQYHAKLSRSADQLGKSFRMLFSRMALIVIGVPAIIAGIGALTVFAYGAAGGITALLGPLGNLAGMLVVLPALLGAVGVGLIGLAGIGLPAFKGVATGIQAMFANRQQQGQFDAGAKNVGKPKGSGGNGNALARARIDGAIQIADAQRALDRAEVDGAQNVADAKRNLDQAEADRTREMAQQVADNAQKQLDDQTAINDKQLKNSQDLRDRLEAITGMEKDLAQLKIDNADKELKITQDIAKIQQAAIDRQISGQVKLAQIKADNLANERRAQRELDAAIAAQASGLAAGVSDPAALAARVAAAQVHLSATTASSSTRLANATSNVALTGAPTSDEAKQLADLQAQLAKQKIDDANSVTAKELDLFRLRRANIEATIQDQKDLATLVENKQQDYKDGLKSIKDLQLRFARDIFDKEESLANARRSNLRGIADAERALAAARMAAARGLQDANKSAAGASSFDAQQRSMNMLAWQLGRLTPLQRKVTEGVWAFHDSWLKLTRGFQNHALELALGVLKQANKDIGILTGAAGMFSDTIVSLGTRLLGMTKNPFWRATLGRLAIDGNTNLKALGNAFITFGQALLVVMDAARPFTHWIFEATNKLANFTLKSAIAGKDSGGLQKYFQKTKEVMQEFGSILKNVWDTFVNLGTAGRDTGMGLLDSLKKTTAGWAAFTDPKNLAHAGEIKKFFHDSAPALKIFMNLMGDLGKEILKVGQKLSNDKDFMKQLKGLGEKGGFLDQLGQAMVVVTTQFGPKLIKFFTELSKSLKITTSANGPISVFITLLTAIVQGINKLADIAGVQITSFILSVAAAFLTWYKIIVPFSSMMRLAPLGIGKVWAAMANTVMWNVARLGMAVKGIFVAMAEATAEIPILGAAMRLLSAANPALLTIVAISTIVIGAWELMRSHAGKLSVSLKDVETKARAAKTALDALAGDKLSVSESKLNVDQTALDLRRLRAELKAAKPGTKEYNDLVLQVRGAHLAAQRAVIAHSDAVKKFNDDIKKGHDTVETQITQLQRLKDQHDKLIAAKKQLHKDGNFAGEALNDKALNANEKAIGKVTSSLKSSHKGLDAYNKKFGELPASLDKANKHLEKTNTNIKMVGETSKKTDWLDKLVDSNKVSRFIATWDLKIIDGMTRLKNGIIKGLHDGLWAGFIYISDIIPKWCYKHLIKPVLDALGIHSPSTVFHNIGSNVVQGLADGITSRFDTIRKVVGELKNLLVNGVKNAWKDVVNYFKNSDTINGFTGTIGHIWTSVKDGVSEAWIGKKGNGGIKGEIAGAWDKIDNFFGGLPKKFTKTVDGIWNAVQSAVPDAFKGILTAVDKGIAGMLNGVITGFNKLIDAFNGVIKDLSLPKGLKLDNIKTHYTVNTDKGGNSSIESKATGGYIQAKPGGVYRVAEAGADELVLTTDPRHRGRTLSLVADLVSRLGVRNFAAGGFTKSSGGLSSWVTGDTVGLNPVLLLKLEQFGKMMHHTVDILSGFRTYAEQVVLWNRYGHDTSRVARPGTSNHEGGLAADSYINGVALQSYPNARNVAALLGLVFPVPGEPWHAEVGGMSAAGGAGAPGHSGGIIGSIGGAIGGISDFVKKALPSLPKFNQFGTFFDGIANSFGKKIHDGLVKVITSQFAGGGVIGGGLLGSAKPIVGHVGEWVLNPQQQRLLGTHFGGVENVRKMLFSTPSKGYNFGSGGVRGVAASANVGVGGKGDTYNLGPIHTTAADIDIDYIAAKLERRRGRDA